MSALDKEMLEAKRAAVRRDELALLARILREGGSSVARIAREVSEHAGRAVSVGEVERWCGISKVPS